MNDLTEAKKSYDCSDLSTEEMNKILPAYDIAATDALWANAAMSEGCDDDISDIQFKDEEVEESLIHMQDETTFNPLVTAETLKVGDLVYDEKSGHKLKVAAIEAKDTWSKVITWKDIDTNSIRQTQTGNSALFELVVEGDTAYEVDDDIELEVHPIDTYFESIKEDMENVTNEEIRLDVVNNVVDALHSMGYDDDFIGSYVHVEAKDTEDGRVKVEVRGELNYDELFELTNRLNKVISKYDKHAYFDMEDSGIASAYLLKDQSGYIVNEELVNAFKDIIDKCATKEELKKVYVERIIPLSENNTLNQGTYDAVLDLVDKKLDLLEGKSVNEELEETNEDGWGEEVAKVLEDVFDKMDRISYEVKNTVRGSYVGGKTVGDLVDELNDVKDMLDDAIDELEDNADRINESTFNEVEETDEKLNTNPLKDLRESDETTPYTKEEVERELKSITHNFTNKEGELKCGFEEEKNFCVEILKQHYKVVEVSGDDRREGAWYHISFATPKLNEKLNTSTKTFSQWFDETQPKDNNEFYPFSEYIKTFESAEVLKDATAMDIVKNAHKFYDVYPVDSSDREKAFLFACDELGIKYDDLYDAWLNDQPIKYVKESFGNSTKSIKESISSDDRRKALANHLGVSVEDVVQTYDENNFEVKSTGEEYIVADYDTAYDLAEQDIRDTFDDLGIDAFTPYFQEWIMDYAVKEDWFEDALAESQRYYYEDMDEDEFIEVCKENDISPDDDNAIDELVDIYLDGIDDYVAEFRSGYGDSEFSTAVKENDLIDLDKVVEEAIRVDGIAHFIAGYDGEEIELNDDLFAYRTN